MFKRIQPDVVKTPPPDKFDYKDPETLKRYMTERGDILRRDRTALSAKQQRELATQIKRARHIALVPFVTTL